MRESIRTFVENPSPLLAKLTETGEPLTLTDGANEFVVVTASAWKTAEENIERQVRVAQLREALQQVANGEALPLDEAFKEIEERFHASLRGKQ